MPDADADATPSCCPPSQRVRATCEHPCPLSCHPPGLACPPCVVQFSKPCHCQKTTLRFACFEVTAAAATADKLRCDKQCLRPLKNCPHLCTGMQCVPGFGTQVSRR